MSNNTRLRKALRKVTKPQTGWLDVFPAVLGDADGTVLTDTAGEIYVRNVLNGQTLRVHNDVAPNTAKLQVEVGRRVERPGLWQVKGVREAFTSPAGGGYIAYHKEQHIFPAADAPIIPRKQIRELTVLVADSANFIVQVYGAAPRMASGYTLIANQQVNLSSHVPTTGALYVNIESDDAGVLTVHAGTAFEAKELATAGDIPVPAVGKYRIATIILFETMEALLDEHILVPMPLETNPSDFVETTQTIGDLVEGSTNKATPIDADRFGFWDSVADILKYATWANIKATLKTYFDTLYSVLGHTHTGLVTNGDTHDHSGGDGAQISYPTLSNLPIAESNANDIFRCDSPGGAPAFAGTIATLPGGATLTYNVTSGQEGAMVPTSTSQLAKMRLYNTTRGTSALISNCVTGTNTITLTANVPAGWATTDVITIASQTVIGTYSWVDLEITSGPTGKSYLFMDIALLQATAGQELVLHPLEAYTASKVDFVLAQVANVLVGGLKLLKITNNVFGLTWTGTPTRVVLREKGYLS